jgi:type VI secretion system protein ImpC
MPKPISFGKIDIGLTAGGAGDTSEPADDTPFRILVIGNFSGRSEDRERAPSWRPIPIDRDNFDRVLATLRPELHLPLAEAPGVSMRVTFSSLDDFHPDQLFGRLELFQSLRDLRQRLSNPATFAAAVADMVPEPKTPAAAEGSEFVASDNLLEQILGKTAARPQPVEALPEGRAWSSFLERILRPHAVSGDDPRQAERLRQVDEAISAQMRALLHAPAFQSLEATWRGMFLLIRRLDTDAHLKVYLLDISKTELLTDLTGFEDLSSSNYYRLLVEQTVGTPGAPPWALVAGIYEFDSSPEEVQALGRLALLSHRAGAPFVAAARPRLLGCDSLEQCPDPRTWKPLEQQQADYWQALRQLPEANYLGLALPRILLRLPYGRETSPTEQFEFEEMTAVPAHESYLWGNPAFALAYLLGAGFSRFGWEARPGVFDVLDGLPLHVFEEDGGRRIKPCAEVLLTERALERILDLGLIPLLSAMESDTVRVGRFQSLSRSGRSLAGRWAE